MGLYKWCAQRDAADAGRKEVAARIVSVEASGHMETVKALVPQAEIVSYAPSLNSLTGGQGSYVMEFAHYEEVPRELAGRIVEEHKAERHGVVAH